MLNKALNHLEELLVTFLMGAATLIIFVAVMHRYLAGVEIPGLQDWLLTLNFGWTQELCIICSSGWPSSVRPMVCAPASTSESMY